MTLEDQIWSWKIPVLGLNAQICPDYFPKNNRQTLDYYNTFQYYTNFTVIINSSRKGSYACLLRSLPEEHTLVTWFVLQHIVAPSYEFIADTEGDGETNNSNNNNQSISEERMCWWQQTIFFVRMETSELPLLLCHPPVFNLEINLFPLFRSIWRFIFFLYLGKFGDLFVSEQSHEPRP